MAIGLPFGLFGTVILIIVLVVLGNALGKSRNVGRTLLSMLAAGLILLMVLVGFAGIFWASDRATVGHDVAELQAQVQAAKSRVEAAKQQVLAREAEVHARIDAIDSPGKRVMNEDPTTRAATEVDVVEVPSVVGPAVAGTVIENPPAESGQISRVSNALSAGVTVAGAPWTDAVEEHQDFEADVYPSKLDAAEALGRRVGERLIETGYAQAIENKPIYVWRLPYEGLINGRTVTQEDITVPRDLLDAVAAGIRRKVADPAYVSVEEPPSGDRDGDVKVYVIFRDLEFDNHNKWGKYGVSSSGAVAVRVDSSAGEFAESTGFREVPWITDRVGFASRYGKGDWVVAYSAGNHTQQDEALRDAVHAAADTLLPMAQARINTLSASDQQRFSRQMAKDPNWLRDRVADELLSRNNVTDRFAQRFDRPYGTVWREAVLVDADQKAVGQIARSLVQGLDSKVSLERITWASYIGLGVLILGTYVFLNMATKGYYTWMLRLAAIAGVGGVIVLIRTLG